MEVPMLAAIFDLGGSQQFLEWGWLRITVPNLVVIVLMVVIFFIAIGMRMGER
jgi:hypothetical protein